MILALMPHQLEKIGFKQSNYTGKWTIGTMYGVGLVYESKFGWRLKWYPGTLNIQNIEQLYAYFDIHEIKYNLL